MKVSFKGDGHHTVTTVYGQDFPVGEWVSVSGLAARKLANNPMFDAEGEDADAEDEHSEPGPSVDELRAELDVRGIRYHPRAGAAKLAALLAEAPASEAQA